MANIPEINFNKIPNKNAKFNQAEFYEENFEKINEQIVPRVNELDAQLADIENVKLPSKMNKLQPVWITPTLLNGWTAFDVGRTPRYRLNDLGQLEITGMVKGGVVGQPIFVLPPGFIPNRTINLSGMSNYAYAAFQVQANGNVRYETGGNVWLVLDFIIQRGI